MQEKVTLKGALRASFIASGFESFPNGRSILTVFPFFCFMILSSVRKNSTVPSGKGFVPRVPIAIRGIFFAAQNALAKETRRRFLPGR